MGKIPVLNGSQMNTLRRLVGGNQRKNLVPAAKQARRTPLEQSENNAIVEEEPTYSGFFRLSYREDVVSGGSATECYAVIENPPPLIYAFGSTFSGGVGGSAQIVSGSAVDIYAQFGYINESQPVHYVTTLVPGGILHPSVKIGRVYVDGGVSQTFAGNASPHMFHPVTSGGYMLALPFLSTPGEGEIASGRLLIPTQNTDAGRISSTTFDEAENLGKKLYISAGYTSAYTLEFLPTSSAVVASAVMIGTLGVDISHPTLSFRAAGYYI